MVALTQLLVRMQPGKSPAHAASSFADSSNFCLLPCIRHTSGPLPSLCGTCSSSCKPKKKKSTPTHQKLLLHKVCVPFLWDPSYLILGSGLAGLPEYQLFQGLNDVGLRSL